MQRVDLLPRRQWCRLPDISRVVLALLGMLALWLGNPPVAGADDAPAFAAANLDGSGELALADLRGEVVLLNIWATWCEPCKEEMPYFERLHQTYAGQGLNIVAVSIDRGDAAKVSAYVEEYGVTFTILRDPGNEISRAFRASGVPETVLIGRNGEMIYRWRGALKADDPGDLTLIEGALAGTVDAGEAIGRIAHVGIPIAFAAGLLSFLSPCVFPLIPTYAAVISGLGLTELRATDPAARAQARRVTLFNGLLFVAGFSLVFIALGASATLVGGWLHDYRAWISRIGGLLLVVLGLHLLGLLRLPWADRDVRVHLANRPGGLVGTFAIGVAFGAGWTPCIGPALASILTLAAADASLGEGVGLLAVYSLGLAIPFLVATVALDRFMAESERVRTWLPRLQHASGALVLLIAALLLTDSLGRLAEYASWSPL